LVAISATDSDGQRFYSSFKVGSIFKRPALTISHVGGQLKLRYTGFPNTKYLMQTTGDMNVWIDAGTVTTDPEGGGEQVVDLTSTSETQFYRLLLQ
jgi:hypothetical protein